jgi:tetratricopeptide (TPR) repeat protein/tRNA A-37 threonylcarbamoyl transferase component Bud32
MFEDAGVTRVPADINWAWIEPIVARFEADCRRQPWPSIDDYLCDAPENDRRALLVELVHADLELRFRAGEPLPIDRYLERFPELAQDNGVVSELMARDLELRERALAVEPKRRLGRFELREMVGQGSFGFVYKAQDTELDRVVAVKIPRLGHLATELDAGRFLREARHAARLRHPGIVTVHEVGRIDETCFLVSDFIAGITLAERLAGGAMNHSESARIVARVADALDHAHAQGIIHRDIKPSNILLDGEGNPHLTDFGLARRADGDATLSVDGKIRGTPAYMAPEHAQGDHGSADARSDIYSLGAVLYELLTGEVPFRGSPRMVLLQVVEEDPRAPRRYDESIPRDLETICLKAMGKEASRRYQTAGALAADLRRFLDGQPVQARPLGRTARLARWCRRRPRLALVAITASLAVCGMAWQWTRAKANLAEARREHRRFGLLLENSQRVTSSILKLVIDPAEPGSIAERADLDRVLEQMDRYVALIREEPALASTLSRLYLKKCEVLFRSGRRGAAKAAMEEAMACWGLALKQHPQAVGYLYGLGSTCLDLVDRFPQDLSAVEKRRLRSRALELYQRAAEVARPGRPATGAPGAQWERRFNDAHLVSRLAGRLGRIDEAIHWLNQAIDCWNVAHPAVANAGRPVRALRSALEWELGSLHQRAGRPEDALVHLIRWRDHREWELKQSAGNVVARKRLSDAFFKTAMIRRECGQSEAALGDLKQARLLWRELPRETTSEGLRQSIRIHVEIGRILDREGRFAQAIESFARARAECESLVRQHYPGFKDRQGLAMCEHVIGNLLCDLNRFAEAAESFRRALVLREAVAREFPRNAGLAADADGTRHRLAEVRAVLTRG